MSIKINTYNQKGERTADIQLSDHIFNIEVNQELLHQAVVTQMANERQVLAHTKGRSEVRGGGAKPWRQKGTGRARAGSRRSPIWIGGGITFGPTKERNFKKKINKKMRQKAIFIVLSDRVRNNNLIVLDELKLTEYKTKIFNDILNNLENKIIKGKKKEKYKRSVLVLNEKDEFLRKSSRNLAGVEIINLDNINVLDLLKYQSLIASKKAIEIIEKRYSIAK